MRYSFEFKMKCVELYRQGIWAETPEKVMKRSFQRKILNWDKIERIHGPKGLERVKKQRNWTVEEKLTFVLQVLNGKALTEVAFSSGISEGLLGSWVHKYKTYGYNGLKKMSRSSYSSSETCNLFNNGLINDVNGVLRCSIFDTSEHLFAYLLYEQMF